MIGKTRKEYVFIRLSISALRLIAPGSIAYLAACLYYSRFIISPWWLGIYPIAEASFFLLVYLPRYAYLQKVSIHSRSMVQQRLILPQGCRTSTTPRSSRATGALQPMYELRHY